MVLFYGMLNNNNNDNKFYLLALFKTLKLAWLHKINKIHKKHNSKKYLKSRNNTYKKYEL